MARFNFAPILVTLGLLGVGGVAYYLATKEKGEGGKELDLQGIIDAITNLFKGGGGGNGGNGNGGNGDGTPCVKKTCTSTEEWNQAQCKCVKKGGGGDPCVKKTCSSSQIWSQSQCKCVPKTAPPPTGGASGSAIFGAAGDWGSGRNSNWRKVADQMIKQKIQTMLGLGDYSYTGVSDWQKVTNYLKSKGIISKGAEGNHDSSSYAKTFSNQSSMLTSFTQGPARVVILNTESGASSNASFLTKTMSTNKSPWVILIMHKPLYTNSSDHGAERSLANALKPIINKYKIQLVLYGHNHNYQRIQKTDQPYTVFVCSGTGGEGLYNLKASESGTKYMNDNDFGFTKISINGNTLRGQFITTSGSVKDSWTQTIGAKAQVAYAYAVEELAPRISI